MFEPTNYIRKIEIILSDDLGWCFRVHSLQKMHQRGGFETPDAAMHAAFDLAIEVG